MVDEKVVEMWVDEIENDIHLILKRSMMVVVFEDKDEDKDEDKEEITLSMITIESRG